MTTEEELFTKTKVDLDKLVKYGFKKDKSLYKYSKNIMNNTFRVDIEIDKCGIIKGKIYDLSVNEEYYSFRIEDNIGSFVNQVRTEYNEILKDIRKNCFTLENFTFKQTNRIVKAIKIKYDDDPEFKWTKFPLYAVFRNKDTHKWYGIIMNIDKNKLNKDSNEEVEIINIKLDPTEVEYLLKENGFYPAYHMNKKSWITILLDDTIKDKDIMSLIEKSYLYTISKHNYKN